jgi:D-alanine-D-alanine ligase
MPPLQDEPVWFRQAVRLADLMSDELGVVLIANVKDQTQPLNDYETDSIVSEFLSEAELDGLVAAFEEAGLYCETVLDEEGFLQWLIERRSQFPRRVPIVYNLAQNGTGPARLSLVAGLCRIYGLLLLDSDGHAVAVSQHKFHASMILSRLGFPVISSWWFTRLGWLPEPPPQGLTLIAKPTYESASIGIDEDCVLTMDDTTFDRLTKRLETYRQPLTVQEFIPGFEVEVPVFEAESPEALIAVGIELQRNRNLGHTLLTYRQVFTDQYDFYDFAEVNAASAGRMLDIAKRAFRSLGFSGIARVDFRVRDDGTPLIMETAAKPHITRHSSVAYAVRALGKSQSDLMRFLVGSAARRNAVAA